jgi:lipoic acid synthetase
MQTSKPLRKPDWLRINLGNTSTYSFTGQIVKQHCLHTICESGRCPNQGECWSQKTATFMIGGDICTRACKFCNTLSGKPLPLDIEEPDKVAESIALLGLKHAVITSVDRDDLPDGGANHWAKTITAIQARNPNTTIEVLIPDFRGSKELLGTVIETRPDIISHNMETVERLTPLVRSVAQYSTSLDVLRQVTAAGIPAKSGLMLGLGETEEEVHQTLHDLLAVGCKLLSLGQYLQPSKKNIPVSAYIHPAVFAAYKEKALDFGFSYVESGPLVRSSYHSVDFVNKIR